jgi:outer membrane protein assembly factor BamB
VRWRYGGPDGAAGVDDPAISGDTLFVSSAFGWASAVDARTGVPIWTTGIAERGFRPALAGDLVIIGTRGFATPDRDGPLGAGHIVALHRATGDIAWSVPMPDSLFPGSGGALNGGVAWQDRVIVGSAISRVYALRLSDGARLWEHVGAHPASAQYGTSRPVVIGGTVVIYRDDNLIEGLDAATGAVRWTMHGVNTLTDPLVTDSLVYIAAGELRAIDAGGNVRWRWGGVDDNGFLVASTPTLSADGVFYSLGLENRKDNNLWVYALALPPQP